jgi:hypothetical protein
MRGETTKPEPRKWSAGPPSPRSSRPSQRVRGSAASSRWLMAECDVPLLEFLKRLSGAGPRPARLRLGHRSRRNGRPQRRRARNLPEQAAPGRRLRGSSLPGHSAAPPARHPAQPSAQRRAARRSRRPRRRRSLDLCPPRPRPRPPHRPSGPPGLRQRHRQQHSRRHRRHRCAAPIAQLKRRAAAAPQRPDTCRSPHLRHNVRLHRPSPLPGRAPGHSGGRPAAAACNHACAGRRYARQPPAARRRRRPAGRSSRGRGARA